MDQKPNPIVVPPALAAKIIETQQSQAAADQIGIEASGKTLPGKLRDAFVLVPDIPVGPANGSALYHVRAFKDGDFLRLAQLGHSLDGFAKAQQWMTDPPISGQDAYTIIWLMTRPIPVVKAKITEGKEAILKAAADEFDELGGLELARLIGAVVVQLSQYMGAKLDYEAIIKEGDPSPPQ